jgi:phenylalanyl-tRNA synthetase beta chain
MGSIYLYRNEEREEPRRACLGATEESVRVSLTIGGSLDVSKGEQATAVEIFRAFKGDAENLLSLFDGDVTYDHQAPEYFHPGRSARALVNGALVAQFGQIHPEVAAARKLRQDVFIAEFDLDQLYALGLRPVKFHSLPKFPAVERDLSFVFADATTFEAMKEGVKLAHIAELRDFRPVEIFRGGSIEAGKYSILLRARFQSSERTLREDEIARWSGQIVSALKTLGGVQRA